MKKLFFMLAISILTIISLYAQGRQVYAGAMTFNRPPALQPISDPVALDNKYLIKIKALRDFNRTYKTVTNEDWYIIPDGFAATFKKESIRYRVIYNKRGSRVATFRYYQEGQLCSEVRHLIKSNWYDATINLITEVSFGGKTAYLVSIEDITSIKTIKVVDNEMEICEEIIKNS
jgi:hypothetical protein